MCLITFLYKTHPDYLLILASNRDEFHDRASAKADFWNNDKPRVFAGRDLQSGGTWIGINSEGCFSAITNFRNPSFQIENAVSRGILVSSFLISKATPGDYLRGVLQRGHLYNRFNILAGNMDEIWYASNNGNKIQKIKPGLHSVSNQFLNTRWPKTKKLEHGFKKILEDGSNFKIEDFFKQLSNKSVPPDSNLPDTGVGLDIERLLSPVFVYSKGYGTCQSTVLLIKYDGTRIFAERTFKFKPDGTYSHETIIKTIAT